MFVYILYSEERSRYYVGQTTDITNRLKRHNLGIVPSTKSGVPWKLVLQIEVLSRSEAMVLERRIKKRGAKRFIDDHFGVYHAYGVAGLARFVTQGVIIAPRLGRGGRHALGVTTPKIGLDIRLYFI